MLFGRWFRFFNVGRHKTQIKSMSKPITRLGVLVRGGWNDTQENENESTATSRVVVQRRNLPLYTVVGYRYGDKVGSGHATRSNGDAPLLFG